MDMVDIEHTKFNLQDSQQEVVLILYLSHVAYFAKAFLPSNIASISRGRKLAINLIKLCFTSMYGDDHDVSYSIA